MTTIPCKVAKGMFSDEWSVEVIFSKRKRETFFVRKEKVYLDEELTDPAKTVSGEVEVVVVEEKGDRVLVDLLSPGITFGPRFSVPKSFLKEN